MTLVWTPCLMHRCVCIWRYILQNYNYKLHFQNLSIYHIPHVSIGTLAVENLDVCTACDMWDNNIQLTMVKDWRQQRYPNIVQCLTLTFLDCHHKCHSNRNMNTHLLTLLFVMISSMTRWPNLLTINTLGSGMPFLNNNTCADGGVIYFCQGFFPCMMPSMDGWRDGWMDGWKKLHAKWSQRPLLYVIVLV
jgi:hypothetical protein